MRSKGYSRETELETDRLRIHACSRRRLYASDSACFSGSKTMGVVKVSGRIIPAFAKQHGPPCIGLVLTPSLGLTKMALITKNSVWL